MRRVDRLTGALLASMFVSLAGASVRAQGTPTPDRLSDVSSDAARTIEDLNQRGSDVSMPPFSDSQIDVNSPFRQALLSRGMALRLVSKGQYAQNTLREPSPTDKQAFVGDSPFQSAMGHLILTSDMRQLGLRHAQLNVSGVWNWVTWRPAGPKVLELWSLYFYKELLNDRIELKVGYNANSLEFVGMQVGGSTASGVQGVYAVLPYEVGMSYFPLTSPQINFFVRGPGHTYLRSSLQRSLDAAGGPATEARNHTGFRFAPNGDKLLIMEELGWRRNASETNHQAWLRFGYLRNSTLYENFTSGNMEPGNHAAYALMDYQLRQPDSGRPTHGLYIGGSAMTAASRFNAYNEYFEARLYQMGPFRKRPTDTASLLATYTAHSPYLTNNLVAQGKTVWRNGASVTGSYNIHVAPGNFLSLGLSYLRGPAITPRIDDALTFSATYMLYF